MSYLPVLIVDHPAASTWPRHSIVEGPVRDVKYDFCFCSSPPGFIVRMGNIEPYRTVFIPLSNLIGDIYGLMFPERMPPPKSSQGLSVVAEAGDGDSRLYAMVSGHKKLFATVHPLSKNKLLTHIYAGMIAGSLTRYLETASAGPFVRALFQMLSDDSVTAT